MSQPPAPETRRDRRLVRVAGYRFRTTLRSRWASYLSIIVLVGLVGGLAIGAIAAARRTQSAYPTFLTSTNPSDLSIATALYSPTVADQTGYNPRLVRAIARLPRVERVASFASLNGNPVGPTGQPLEANANVTVLGSVDGEYFNQDRVTVTEGRMSDPRRADQIIMTAGAARQLRLHVGQRFTMGFYSLSQTIVSPSSAPPLHLGLAMTLVGIVEFNNAVVQDDVDANGAQNALVTPTLTRRLLQCCAFYSFSYLKLEHGSRDVAAVEGELRRVFPSSLPFDPHATSVVVAKAERAVKPETLAIGVFGGIAALATLVIAAQVMGRQLRSGADDLGILRALGADPATTMTEGVPGIIGAVVVGALLAAAVAVGLSPLAPIGAVRAVYPARGIAFDWTVLVLGTLALVLALSAVAVVIGYRMAPHRAALLRGAVDRESSVASAAASAGLPPPAVTGMRFALEPGSGPTAVPVRSAILGAALAITVVIATLTFGASLDALVSHPALYGWNWNYELSGSGGVGDIPLHRANVLLGRDRSVAAWSGAYFGNLQIDGQSVPVLGQTPRAALGPPVLTGHGLESPKEIVLGETTLAQLHKRIGDTVDVRYGSDRPTRLVVVGTATMPTIGLSGVDVNHLSMGTGALLSWRLIPAVVWNSFANSPPGPNAIFVKFKAGTNPQAAVHALRRVAAPLNLKTNFGVSVVSVQRPAEIVNYRSMGTTPAVLGLALAAGAVFGLGLTLVASVRRRHRDLALLKTIGFTKRQLGAVVAWQATMAVATGALIGVPVGIVLGRVLWKVFAQEIDAIPGPNVPVVSVVLIAFGALVVANIVAAIPGRIAARTPTAVLLRSE